METSNEEDDHCSDLEVASVLSKGMYHNKGFYCSMTLALSAALSFKVTLDFSIPLAGYLQGLKKS